VPVTDLPDYTRQVAVEVTVAPILPIHVIVRPRGGILAKGSVTTTSAYQAVAQRVVTSGTTFQLSRLIFSAEKGAWVKWRWNGVDVGPEILLDDRTVGVLHFPWDYYDMEGDGVKVFDVQAKYYETSGTVNAEIVGEEVTT